MSPAEVFLQAIGDAKVRRIGSGVHANRWIACCPAHNDINPSLQITEMQDGRLLLHCFSQHCGAIDIVNALGLNLGDLYPEEQRNYTSVFRPRGRTEQQGIDEMVLGLAKIARSEGKRLSPSDLKAEREAFFRLRTGGRR